MISRVKLENYPSIMQTKPQDTTTKKYSFIPTTRVVQILEAEGWIPVDAQEAHVTSNPAGYQKHMIRFQHPDITTDDKSFAQQILMANAHNASSSFWLMGGGINFACLNGIIIAENIIANHRIRHSGFTDEIVKEAVYRIVEDMPKAAKSIETFRGVQLSAEERISFGKDSLELFYNPEQLDRLNVNASAELISAPRRKVEKENTLWNTFNVVQENMIKGGLFLQNKATGKVKQKRPTTSIDTNIHLNSRLWTFAEEVAEDRQALSINRQLQAVN